MSIIQNKDIYDPSKGDPLEPIKKSLKILDSQIEDLTKSVLNLQKALRGIQKTGDGSELKKTVEITAKLKTETEALNKTKQASSKISEQIKKAESQLVALYDSEAQQLAEVKLELQERRAELKKTAKDNKVAKDSLTGLNIELSKLRKQYDLLSKEQRENAQVGGKLLQQIQKLDTETKQLSATTGRFQKNVGNYPGLFNSTTFSLKGLGTELLAAGGVVGGVQLLIEGFKAFAGQVQKNIEITQQLQSSFDIASREARSYAGNILAIADTFDQDYNEVTQAAISVSKQLGISVEEATSRIEEGFLKGSNNSGEFLDILKEYPAQFKAAGIDADQAFAIINKQVTEGIYSDKGVDAIKEGGLRLREFTKATEDSLRPLGESINAQIRQEIAAGRSFEAIQLVSEALNDTSLTAEETQSIIANVFGGPGEDAGLEYLQSLKDIESSLADVAVQASDSEQASLELSKSWNEFVAVVSDSDGLLSKVWAGIKSGVADALSFVTKEVDRTFKAVQEAANLWRSSSETISAAQAGLQKKIREEQEKTEQKNKETNVKVNENERLTEAERQKRFKAWQRRQEQIAKEQEKRIEESDRRIEQTQKEIDKLDELANEELEAQFLREEALTEKQIEENDKRVQSSIDANAEVVNDQLISAETQQQILESTAQFAANTLQGLIEDGKLSIESFGKFLIASALDLLEKQLIASIAAITFREAGTKGLGSAFTIPILTALVKGAFSVAKGALQRFAGGEEFVQGPGTETSDSIPAMLSKGERVLKASENKKLIRAGIGNDELADLAIMGKYGGNIQVNDQSKLLEKLDRLGLAYKRGGYWYIERGNGKVEKFKE